MSESVSTAQVSGRFSKWLLLLVPLWLALWHFEPVLRRFGPAAHYVSLGGAALFIIGFWWRGFAQKVPPFSALDYLVLLWMVVSLISLVLLYQPKSGLQLGGYGQAIGYSVLPLAAYFAVKSLNQPRTALWTLGLLALCVCLVAMVMSYSTEVAWTPGRYRRRDYAQLLTYLPHVALLVMPATALLCLVALRVSPLLLDMAIPVTLTIGLYSSSVAAVIGVGMGVICYLGHSHYSRRRKLLSFAVVLPLLFLFMTALENRYRPFEASAFPERATELWTETIVPLFGKLKEAPLGQGLGASAKAGDNESSLSRLVIDLGLPGLGLLAAAVWLAIRGSNLSDACLIGLLLFYFGMLLVLPVLHLSFLATIFWGLLGVQETEQIRAPAQVTRPPRERSIRGAA